MTNLKYPAIIFLLVVTISLILPIFYYPRLPETIASHYNIGGEPDATMSKQTIIIIHSATIIFLTLLFSIMIYFIPKLPRSMVDLPNDDFWLNENNREETFAVLRRFIFWLGSIVLGFLSLFIQEVYNTNITGNSKLTFEIWIYLAIMLFLTAIIIIKMILYFKKPNKLS